MLLRVNVNFLITFCFLCRQSGKYYLLHSMSLLQPSSISLAFPLHGFPPLDGAGFVQVRLRFLVPPPHGLERKYKIMSPYNIIFFFPYLMENLSILLMIEFSFNHQINCNNVENTCQVFFLM